MSECMAQSSLVPAQEMPRWMLGMAPCWPLFPFSSVLKVTGLGGEITLFCAEGTTCDDQN